MLIRLDRTVGFTLLAWFVEIIGFLKIEVIEIRPFK